MHNLCVIFFKFLSRKEIIMPFLILISFLSCIVLIGFPSTAHAYLDPGTGSILLQALAAGFIAAAAFWRRILRGIKNLFHKDKAE